MQSSAIRLMQWFVDVGFICLQSHSVCTLRASLTPSLWRRLRSCGGSLSLPRFAARMRPTIRFPVMCFRSRGVRLWRHGGGVPPSMFPARSMHTQPVKEMDFYSASAADSAAKAGVRPLTLRDLVSFGHRKGIERLIVRRTAAVVVLPWNPICGLSRADRLPVRRLAHKPRCRHFFLTTGSSWALQIGREAILALILPFCILPFPLACI